MRYDAPPAPGMSDWQACCADWNRCELGLTPLMGGIEMPLPFETGLGKFAIPCERRCK